MAADFALEGDEVRDDVGGDAASDQTEIGGRLLIKPAEPQFGDRLGCQAEGIDAVFRIETGMGGQAVYLDLDLVGRRGADDNLVYPR